jgi:hypothetical protein
MKMLGENGTEQFTITTRVDGKLIREQKIHDPFLHSKTTVAISRWDLFKALFRSQFTVVVQTSVHGTEGIQRAIMTLDTAALDRETASILEARRLSREGFVGQAYHCGEIERPLDVRGE